jgi:hypothetical protein
VPDLGLQIFHIQKKFPQFKYRRKGIWIGTLIPKSKSPAYKVKIIERRGKRPLVFVLEPKINENAPHIYPDGSLCIYYPKDFSWDKKTLIANTIIPWTALRLYFYEIWLETGIWYGESIEHKPRLLD